jgi:hypothetical protein
MAAERAFKAAQLLYQGKMSALAATLPRACSELELEHAAVLACAIQQIRELALGVEEPELLLLEKSICDLAASCAPALLPQRGEGGPFFFGDRLEGSPLCFLDVKGFHGGRRTLNHEGGSTNSVPCWMACDLVPHSQPPRCRARVGFQRPPSEQRIPGERSLQADLAAALSASLGRGGRFGRGVRSPCLLGESRSDAGEIDNSPPLHPPPNHFSHSPAASFPDTPRNSVPVCLETDCQICRVFLAVAPVGAND